MKDKSQHSYTIEQTTDTGSVSIGELSKHSLKYHLATARALILYFGLISIGSV